MYDAVREIGDKLGMCYAIGDRGIIYAETGRPQDAIACYREKLEIAEEMGDGYNIWEGWYNMGAAYFDLQEYAAAIDCLDRSIEIAQKTHAKHPMAMSLLRRAETLLNWDKVEQSQRAYVEAIEAAQGIDDIDLAYDSSLLGCRIDFLSGDEEAIQRLEALRHDFPDERKQAEITYYLWEMSRSPEHRATALELHRQLCAHTNRHLYKTRLETLQSTA
jgi:tetratricopeptide (TPR) repeat protein